MGRRGLVVAKAVDALLSFFPSLAATSVHQSSTDVKERVSARRRKKGDREWGRKGSDEREKDGTKTIPRVEPLQKGGRCRERERRGDRRGKHKRVLR